MRREILATLSAVTLSTAMTDAAAQTFPPPVAPLAGGVTWHVYSGSAGARRYRLFVPATYDPARPAPLVVMLHGCTQDPDDFARGTRFNSAAADAGVIVVWPEQTAQQQPQKCWSWYDPAHQAAGAGEPAIIAGITREVMASHAVDPARVYVAGVSAGAAMAVNTAAAYPELYAAVAAHSGIAYRAAQTVPAALSVMKSGAADPDALAGMLKAALGPHRPALIAIHGGADVVVVPANSRQLAAQWAGALGLGPAAESTSTEDGASFARTVYDDAGGAPQVELLIVAGVGHAWSGGSPEGTFTHAGSPDATAHILRFLLAHPRR